MDFHSSGGFPKRRSYPNLQHISLAPLTPRFPIGDEPTDYFNYHREDPLLGDDTITPTRSSSYLSSVSVPSTPPILSHSRSTSRTRHHSRSKSFNPASDSNLHSKSISIPLHHSSSLGPKKRPSALDNNHNHRNHPTTKSDAEWLLRAGIAIASSTREEKGQSWLSKRESSTSLVSEMPFDDPAAPPHHRHHHRTKSGTSSRKSASGTSTPGAYSRRSSRSRGTSRHGSRAGLTMTSVPPLSFAQPGTTAYGNKTHSPSTTGAVTPETRGRTGAAGMVPDFVDERIRAEMESLQEGDLERDRGRDLFGHADLGEDLYEDGNGFDSEDEFSDESHEEFDEADLQSLTRERGFGLGSWIDRLVEWTLFGLDELPISPVPSSTARIGGSTTTTTVTFEELDTSFHGEQDQQGHDMLLSAPEGDLQSSIDDVDVYSHTDGESTTDIEKPGDHGGWEDASWLFRVVKRALI
ncbi:hypothetical protein N7454_011222 [Penicillium verhagenii]|nr:hypothetical protein N7454_011222 [Penicillium verhagenii]